MKTNEPKTKSGLAKQRAERGYTVAGHACINCVYRRWVEQPAAGDELRCFYDGAPVHPAACCDEWSPEQQTKPTQ